MERRIATAIILVENNTNISKLNLILSNHSEIIIGRQGIPLKERGINVISLILEGNTDQIGSLTGQIGKLEGIQVKSAILKYSNQI